MRLLPLLAAAAAAAAASTSLPAAEAAGIPILDVGAAASVNRVVEDPGTLTLPRFAEEEPAAAAEPPKKAEPSSEPFKPAGADGRFTPTCDLAADTSICLFGGKKVLLPDAAEKKVVAQYTFDSSHCVDGSGYQNHGAAVVPTGPGRLGRGASAYFDGDVWMEVPGSESLAHAARRATASFWVYVRPDVDFTVDNDCSLVLFGGPEAAAWQVGFNPKGRTLSFAALKGKVAGTSFAKLRVAQWTHVSLVLGRDTLKLFVNGIPDRAVTIDAAAEASAGAMGTLNLYAGRAPWESGQCHIPMLMDDLRVYARAVTEYEIGASSFGALGAVDPAFVRLGTVSGTFDEALAACKEPYHLCAENDMYAGAMQVARAMSWASGSDKFWRSGPHEGSPDEKRVGLCCRD